MLNKAQAEACRLPDGPALIVAGAGTGKTHTLTQRLVYLIKERKIKPENILCLTFTHKAAEEMRQRAEGELGAGTLRNLFLGTFHQLGLKIIRQEIHRLNLKPDFVIYDRLEQEEVIRAIRPQLSKKLSLSIRRIIEKISELKENIILPEEKGDRELSNISELYEAYGHKLKEANALDFDDLILLPITIFKNYPGVLTKYQELLSHILVDEYQDIDQAQYELLNLLAKKHHNLWAIGDSDQAIYSFRGGNLENFLEFKNDYPGAKFITLTENYRSSETILKASHCLIEKNTRRLEKELRATIPGGAKLSLLVLPDEEAEAKAIVTEIQRELGGTSHYEIYRGKGLNEDTKAQGFSDFAVLYRLHHQSHHLVKAFRESGIPYQVIGGTKKENMKRIKGLLEADKNIEDASLVQGIDLFDERADTVALMTLHAAKGLEFPVVFIVGLEEGLLPYEESKEYREAYEEERRLFYVGLTRARRKVYLLLTRSRLLFGQRRVSIPSPFLAELPEEVLEKKDLFKKRHKERQLNFWKENP